MNRKSIAVAGGLLVAVLAGSAAHAHNWGCYVQADRNVKIRNTASAFSAEASAAISEWNSRTILNITNVSSGQESSVFSSNAGNTGWGGLATLTSVSGCTILKASAQLNTYYSWTSNAARGVFCQEVGHTFGLDHSNDGGCMGGGYWYDIGTHYTLVSHNITDVGTKYANRTASLGEPDEDMPRFHAYWINNPRTLGETARLASEIVVATVSDVVEGDSIETPYDGGVNVIPTQRVFFNVKRSVRGNLGAGASFVLFQNGNDEGRFAEDPAYKVGHRYLLLLTPRLDGTYLVVSPAGRYEITRDGLVPAAEKGFAVGLAGASLQDVTLDVTRSLEAFEQ